MAIRRSDGEADTSLMEPQIKAVAGTLLAWFLVNGRTYLWRTTSNPYVVLVAEILLRKTGSAAVERFLPSFLELYPDLTSTSAAPIGDLSRDLAPLGLGHQRAVQLRELAQAVILRFDGNIPSTKEELTSLPGVGPYTAGMILSTSFGISAPAVDGNVARILCRLFDIKPSHAEARKSSNVWQIAEQLSRVRMTRPVEMTWALLDLGANICLARQPKCRECPVSSMCLFFAHINDSTL